MDSHETIELTDEQLKSAREAFKRHDVNGDGHIPTSRLGDVMRTLGHRLKRHELQDLIKDVDADDSGTIDWEEFLPLMAAKLKEREEQAFYKDLFRMLDKQRRGCISCDDLTFILKGLAKEVELTQEEIDDMVAAIDEDGNGEVSFEEFYKLMTSE